MGRHKKNIESDVLDTRRVLVASLLAKGLSLRAIVAAMAKEKYINPQTKEPYTLFTIHHDVVAIRKEWHENAIRSIQEWKDQQLAEINELMRQAYLSNKLDTVARCIELKIKLTGTAEAEKIDLAVGPTKTYMVVSPENWPKPT